MGMSFDEAMGYSPQRGRSAGGVMSFEDAMKYGGQQPPQVQPTTQLPQQGSGFFSNALTNLGVGLEQAREQTSAGLGALAGVDSRFTQLARASSDPQYKDQLLNTLAGKIKDLNQVTISDEGRGLASQQRDQLFSLYRQVAAVKPGQGLPSEQMLGKMTPRDRESFVSGALPRAIGSLGPMALESAFNPMAGVGLATSQGVGSAHIEGAQQGYTPTQTNALAVERGGANALLAMVPGGKGGAGFVGELLKGVGKAAGINIGQSGVEAGLKSALGVKSDGVWVELKHSATSGDQWAQAVLLGGVHALGEVGWGGKETPTTPTPQATPLDQATLLQRAQADAFSRLTDKQQTAFLAENKVRALGGQDPLLLNTDDATKFFARAQYEKGGNKVARPPAEQSGLGGETPTIERKLGPEGPIPKPPPMSGGRLTTEEFLRVGREDQLRAVGGQGPMDEAERVKFLSQPEAKSVVGPKFGGSEEDETEPESSEKEPSGGGAHPSGVDTSHDVPYLAGKSQDGSTVYLDQSFAKHLDQEGGLKLGDGVMPKSDVLEALTMHEDVEQRLMKAGQDYQTAHKSALQFEKSVVEGAGFKWEDYQAAITPFIHDAEHESIQNPPKDLDVQPYHDSHDTRTEAQLQEFQKENIHRAGGFMQLPGGEELKKLREGLGSTTNTLARGFETFTQALRNSGPQARVQAEAENLSRVADRTKVRMAQMQKTLAPAISTLTKPWAQMMGQVHDGPDGSFIATTRAGAEPQNYPELASQLKQGPARQQFNDANLAVGKNTEDVLGNKAKGEMARLVTSDAMQHVIRWDSDLQRFMGVLEKMNPGVGRARIEQFFSGVHEDLVAGRVDAAQKKVAQEFSRTIPRVPSGLKNGQNLEYWFHDRPVDYLMRSAESLSGRAAFKEIYGDQSMTSIGKALGDIKEGNPQAPKLFYDAASAIHGLPTGLDKQLNAPGGLHDTLQRVVNPFTSLAWATQLTKAAPHILASIPTGQAFRNLGLKWAAAGMADLVSNPRETVQKLQMLGKVDRLTTDLSFDPNSKFLSGLRITKNAFGSLVDVPHWFTSVHMAASAQALADGARMGELSSSDTGTFRFAGKISGLGDSFLNRLADGKGSVEEYDRYVRTVSTFATSRMVTPTERSYLEASKVFTSNMKASTYPFTTLRNITQNWRTFIEAHNSGDSQLRTAAVKGLVRNALGIGAQAVVVNLVRSLLSGGTSGLKVAFNENEDDAKKETAWWTLGLLSTGIGGPAAVVSNLTHSNPSTYYADISYPAGLITDLVGAIKGSGKYKDMDWGERWKSFGEHRGGLGPVINTWAGIMATGERSTELDAGIGGLHDWKRLNNIPTTQVVGGASDPESFRAYMRRGAEDIKADRDPSDNIVKALGAKSFADISESLSARRLLYVDGKPLTPEQQTSLREHIGDSAFQRLADFDNTLDAWSLAFHLASKESKAGREDLAKSLATQPTSPEQLSQLKSIAAERAALKELRSENRSGRRSVVGASSAEISGGGE